MANFYQDEDLPLKKIKYSSHLKKTFMTTPTISSIS